VKPDQQQKDKGYQGFPPPLGRFGDPCPNLWCTAKGKPAISRLARVLLFGDKPGKIS
jgi:hypothetical protein